MMVYVTINVFGLKIIKLPNQAKCAMPFEISSNSLLVNDNIPFFVPKCMKTGIKGMIKKGGLCVTGI